MEHRWITMSQSFPIALKLPFFFIQPSLGCYKPFTVFQSSDKVDHDNFACFGGGVFVEKSEIETMNSPILLMIHPL